MTTNVAHNSLLPIQVLNMTKMFLTCVALLVASSANPVFAAGQHGGAHDAHRAQSAKASAPSREDCMQHRQMDMGAMNQQQHADHMAMMAACESSHPESADKGKHQADGHDHNHGGH